MKDEDPFNLPEGYGGVGGEQAPPRDVRARVDRLEAELRAIAGRADPVVPPSSLSSQTPPYTGTILRDDPAVAPSKWRRRWPWIRRGILACALLFVVLVGWLAITAPLTKSLRPIVPSQLTLVSADGRPIARNGAIVDKPVDVKRLPPHVINAFLAIEDRRFYSHWGVDPRGIARAGWNNLTGGSKQGGSTITQQLAKFTFLNADRTMSRKAREMLIAWWMEAWLTKDEILSRYLSNAYFGDNVYGLRAASLHYFYRQPERLTLSQAAMLAGLVQAPSRLAPTHNLKRAQTRETLVLNAMVDAGFLTAEQRRGVRLAVTDSRMRSSLPSGTYFADWAMPEARSSIEPGYEEARVTTTLDARLQDIARRVTAGVGGGNQVALVAMRPNGEVVAMIGGRDYARSPFNRATQALRQPGSTFKLFVYLAALKSGMTPETMVDDTPITTGEYRPANYGGTYRGRITLKQAFAASSNVVAVRLYHQLGGAAVEQAARDLGVASPIARNASSALGSSGMTLLELTSAYAGLAANYAPVDAHALRQEEASLIDRLFDGRGPLPNRVRQDMLELLSATINGGTGRAARLSIPAYGKTGTTQDGRDALFVGFAGDLVVGVWIGRDDNRPVPGLTGGGQPARIWRDFMGRAIPGAVPRAAPQRPRPQPQEDLPQIFDDLGNVDFKPQISVDPDGGVTVGADVGDVNVSIGRDGIAIKPGAARSGGGTAPPPTPTGRP